MATSKTAGNLRICGRMLASVTGSGCHLRADALRRPRSRTLRWSPPKGGTTYARYSARRARDAQAWPCDHRDGPAGRREGLGIAGRGSIPDIDCHAALGANAGRDDAPRRRACSRARTPRTLAKLSVEEIERLIYPVSFYRNKARHVKACCEMLVDRYRGHVPSTMDELVTLPGVGRKTANLVLILGFKSGQNICVDTHVHRISNRLGWVRTRQPEETEQALYRSTESRWWPLLNRYLVTWDRTCAGPSIRAADCAIAPDCRKIGVRRRT